MIEKVARAIAAAYGRHEMGLAADDTARYVNEKWPRFMNEARAAVEALREPDEAMIEAGVFADVPWEWEETDTGKTVVGPFALELSGPDKIERAKEVVAALHRAMIDHILNGERKP